MLYLKQSTANQSVVIGPFVDDTDGVTPETGLTISNTDIRLSKNGGNIVAKNSGGGTHDELGMYTITLDATDTNTVGRLQLVVAESGALPVYATFQVLEESVYDALFGSGASGYAAAGDEMDIVDSPNSTAVTAIQSGLATATALTTVDTVVDGIKAVTDNLPDSGALTSIAAAADLTTVDGVVDAIKAKTDNLPSDPADQSLLVAETDAIAALLATAQADLDIITGADGVNLLSATQASIDAIEADTDELQTNQGNWLTATGFAVAGDEMDLVDSPNSTAIAEFVTALLAGTCDTGVSVAKAGEMLAALAAGKVTVSSNAGVSTLTYKKRDGSTTSFTTVVTESNKTRAATGALS